MSSLKTFEDLQNLGVNELYERTHIARHQIELLLNKSFEKLSRVQFMGFISILEREYSIDLSSLRDDYDREIPIQRVFDEESVSTVLQAKSTERKKWIVGAIVTILLLVIITSITQKELSSAPNEEILKLNSVVAKIGVENNRSLELNTTIERTIVEANVSNLNENKMVPESLSQEQNSSTLETQGRDFGHVLSIKPTSNVWMGMMDLDSGKKTQRKTKKPIIIDTTKNWLFIFGHGRLQILTSEGSRTLKEKNTAWFIYENGSLKQLSREEFEEKNHGSKW